MTTFNQWWDDLFRKPPAGGERSTAIKAEIAEASEERGAIGAPVPLGVVAPYIPPDARAAMPSVGAAPDAVAETPPGSRTDQDYRGRLNPAPSPGLGRTLAPPRADEVIVNVLSVLRPMFSNAERFIRELPERMIGSHYCLAVNAGGAGYAHTILYPAHRDQTLTSRALILHAYLHSAGGAAGFAGHIFRAQRTRIAAAVTGVNVWSATTPAPVFMTPSGVGAGPVSLSNHVDALLSAWIYSTAITDPASHVQTYPFKVLDPDQALVWEFRAQAAGGIYFPIGFTGINLE